MAGSPYRYAPTLLELARDVDLLGVAAAGAATRGLVSRDVLEALGPNGYLINVARGAGLDVFVDEPNVPEALLGLDNVVLLPHVSSGTVETRADMESLTLANLDEFLATGADHAGRPGAAGRSAVHMSIVLSYISSPEGRGALPFGFAEARMRATDLIVIAEGDSASSADFEPAMAEAQAAADAAEVKWSVAENVPDRSHADNLVDASYEAGVELLVIGMKRRSPVGKLLLGSIAQQVLLDAHCPVVAVKPPVQMR